MLVEGNYKKAMSCYLEVGSMTTSFFSRPVPYSVWDEKVCSFLRTDVFLIIYLYIYVLIKKHLCCEFSILTRNFEKLTFLRYFGKSVRLKVCPRTVRRVKLSRGLGFFRIFFVLKRYQ